jgi:hypothetical protein
VIPVVPLLAWWDATVSSLRSYTVEELSEMAGDLGAGYVWDVGIVRVPLPAVSMTYLIGTPKPGGGA